jgi:hypothetical protein
LPGIGPLETEIGEQHEHAPATMPLPSSAPQ